MDILNLEYNRLRLYIMALNKAETKKQAASMLGISERTMLRVTITYKIQWNRENG